jgi:uncharacterized repeat protein (TIGR01451 family)
VSRMLVAGVVALAAFFALQASSALGAPQTQTFIGDEPGTPDIRRTDLLYFRPSGARASTGSAGTLNLALNGQPVVGYCVQVNNPLNTGTVVADVTAVPTPSADDRAILWILQNQTPTGPPTPAKQQQAATAQVAVWVIRGQLHAVNPTNDAALNAAVAALIATARAESATPATLSLTGTPGAGAATISVTAKPGAVVALAVTSGPGTLSSTSVTVGPGGTATATLSSPGAGPTVSATTKGDGTLFAINPNDGSQNSAVAAASQLSASVTVAQGVVNQVVTPASTPFVRVPRGALRLTKTAPARAKVLSQVHYTITVRNASRVRVRNVRLRDRIPDGMSFARATGGGTLQGGRIQWSLGTLAPGASRTFSVWLQACARRCAPCSRECRAGSGSPSQARFRSLTRASTRRPGPHRDLQTAPASRQRIRNS